MRHYFRDFLLLICISTGIAVIMEFNDKNKTFNQSDEENVISFSEAFAQCLAKKVHETFECVNEGSLTILRSMNEKDSLDFGEVKLERSETQARDLLDLDYDPKDFKNVIKAAARLMERRNLKWDLSNLYPGLQMRVGPALNGNGMLEFIVDERNPTFTNRQLGPGRMLVKNLVLPFLLGLKFSLSSLIPLVFGVLLVITKKALFLTKIALLLSGLLGWNAFISSPNYGGIPQGIPPGFSHGFNDYGFNHHYGHDYNAIHEHHHPYRPYRNIAKDIGVYNQHVIREIVDVYDSSDGKKEENSHKNSKNFVWSRD
ncbi:uncharacterized protein Osi10a [Chelonus insularis]|uniref:uncharacterized protein Osi10a n=1 Tax=Chelonus insularis TaxID=460826 RepID=UPI00158B534B|nr:uncharacterized protein LOC118073417 [Chelonus insularis]